MGRAGIPCWHCERGSILPDLAGGKSCVACGASEHPPVTGTARDRGTNRPRWDRVAASAWQGDLQEAS